MLRKIVVKWSVLGAIFLGLTLGGWVTTSAQLAPWRVGQGSDGTLYLVTNGTRYVINPDKSPMTTGQR